MTRSDFKGFNNLDETDDARCGACHDALLVTDTQAEVRLYITYMHNTMFSLINVVYARTFVHHVYA